MGHRKNSLILKCTRFPARQKDCLFKDGCVLFNVRHIPVLMASAMERVKGAETNVGQGKERLRAGVCHTVYRLAVTVGAMRQCAAAECLRHTGPMAHSKRTQKRSIGDNTFRQMH